MLRLHPKMKEMMPRLKMVLMLLEEEEEMVVLLVRVGDKFRGKKPRRMRRKVVCCSLRLVLRLEKELSRFSRRLVSFSFLLPSHSKSARGSLTNERRPTSRSRSQEDSSGSHSRFYSWTWRCCWTWRSRKRWC